ENGDTRVAGLPHLEQWVTPTGEGGQLYAQLVDLDDGNLHLGHAIMDLRYAEGGRAPQPVAPGLAMKVRLEFEPLDFVLPAGHRLGLEFSGIGEDYVSPTVASPILLNFGEGQAADNHLELPLVTPARSQFFTPPAWSGDADAVGPGT
ncbi:MAG: CocE/NonD family hydrolase C-terminal non-catalytic domain-containing protein, partial [Candidatus Thermoplasmatota archaeon]